MAHRLSIDRISSSFRDPSGFLFRQNGELYRQVNSVFRENYDHLMASNLYSVLVQKNLLVPHQEIDLQLAATENAYRVLKPQIIPFVSYPYEWTVGQLRKAALLTLEIQKYALAHGMILKDASAFNIQFIGSTPIFVDTLSFEIYNDGDPWIAYRQFCQHFLAPLKLASSVDTRLLELMRRYLDGIPLDLASRLLPKSSWLSLSTLLHIHLHSRSIARHSATDATTKPSKVGGRVKKRNLSALIDNLEGAVRSMSSRSESTEWAQYEAEHGYSDESYQDKKKAISRFINAVKPGTVLDLGANTGDFSRVSAATGAYVVSVDGDTSAVERSFGRLQQEGSKNILPLRMDLTNPSPSQGWAHIEWSSFQNRGPFDLVLALALIHHLAIGNNVPIESILSFLSSLGTTFVIEWVPKTDPQVIRLLRSREDIFSEYSVDCLEKALDNRFRILERHRIVGTERVLYLISQRT